MTRKKFISMFTDLVKRAVRLNKKSLKFGIAAIEDEIEDIDDEFYKKGLRLVADGSDALIINEILSNDLTFIKNKYTCMYMTIIKRMVLGIQEKLSIRHLVFIALSLAGLSKKERYKIEMELLKDDDESDPPSEINNVKEDDIVAQYDYSTNKRHLYMTIEDIQYATGEQNPRGVIFGNDTTRKIIITKDCPYPERIIKIISGEETTATSDDLDLDDLYVKLNGK